MTIWAILPDHEGHEVSFTGEVRNIKKQTILNTSVNQGGVRYVSIRNTTLGKYENRAVGSLVASAFCEGRSPDADTVLHLDGDLDNNSASNLMWTTRWHAIAYHNELQSIDRTRRNPVQDILTGQVYGSLKAAAMDTGCLPSAIDYGRRYNDSLETNGSLNFVHRTYPGGHIFKSA